MTQFPSIQPTQEMIDDDAGWIAGMKFLIDQALSNMIYTCTDNGDGSFTHEWKLRTSELEEWKQRLY